MASLFKQRVAVPKCAISTAFQSRRNYRIQLKSDRLFRLKDNLEKRANEQPAWPAVKRLLHSTFFLRQEETSDFPSPNEFSPTRWIKDTNEYPITWYQSKGFQFN